MISYLRKLISYLRKLIYTYMGIPRPIGLRPADISIRLIKNSTSISDAFCWRTDNNFKTIFRFSDILKLFYNINSKIELVFYSKNNKFIKNLILNNIDISNELIIDKKFMNDKEDYGLFYIYHQSNQKFDNAIIIANKCYLGYSKNNHLPSFVHGNTLAKFKNINGGEENSDLVATTLFQNEIYRIQDFLNDFSHLELFFSNPTSKKIKYKINNKKYVLLPFQSKIVDFLPEKFFNLTIQSNCLFIRPMIFKHKHHYLDVHHS